LLALASFPVPEEGEAVSFAEPSSSLSESDSSSLQYSDSPESTFFDMDWWCDYFLDKRLVLGEVTSFLRADMILGVDPGAVAVVVDARGFGD